MAFNGRYHSIDGDVGSPVSIVVLAVAVADAEDFVDAEITAFFHIAWHVGHKNCNVVVATFILGDD